MERVTTEEYTAEDSSIIRMTVAEARDSFADTVNRVTAGEERVLLSQDGKDVAAVISIEEFWLLESLIRDLEDEMDLEAVRATRKDVEEEGTISLAELRKELGW